MNERDIFLAAIEIADPVQRASYVEQACGSDANLRAQVEELLKNHAQSSQFLESPAVAADASVAQTLVTAAFHADEDSHAERASAEAEFRKYLLPATRAGWLGRLGHYEIESILGRGAFGIVAKAFDEKLHRVVAIKLMNPELAATSPPRQRFLREARTAAAVTHENVVAIHAVEEEPIPYLVMEYIPGQTLQQRMDDRGPFEAKEVLRIGQQVAAGLAAAHGANLIHRDIKPSNILLAGGPADRAKISDFGLARAVDDATMTSSGLIAGTPMYMAPEQARGETLDHRADLFSLGSVLYQMASGRPPFRAANTVAVLKRVCEDTPRPLDDVIPGIPGWLETIVFKLLEKKRDDRYQTAQELADLLARCQSELQHQGQVTCVQGIPRAGETQVLPARTGNRSATGRWPIGWLAGGVIAGVAVMGLLLINGGRQNPERSRAKPAAETTATATAQAPKETSAGIGWHGWPSDAPPPAIAPFDAEQAKQHQAAWAKYLGVPVEYTNSLGMKFRLIPPGEFLMGSTKEEIEEALKSIAGDQSEEHWKECIKSEGPKHTVTLRQGFYLGMHEVTQQEYEKVVGANPSNFAPAGRKKEAVAGIDTTRHPVEQVTWDEAVAFCVKLNHQEELKPHRPESDPAQPGATPEVGYRLPTDAEWEFACRAGTTSRYWIGVNEEELTSVGWFSANSAGRTHRVGELNPNPFGLFDVHGNVFEYVRDWWNPTYFTELQGASAIDPSGPTLAGSRRVVRSGSYGYKATYNRVSSRGAYLPAQDRNHHIGFRVSLSVDAVRQALKVDGSKIVKPGVPVGANGNSVAEQGRSAWDDLDPAQIPEAERVPNQPEGLVAVLGQHRRRVWNEPRSASVSLDGTQFMVATDDGLYLFKRDPKQPARYFNVGHKHSSATFLPDGRIAASVHDGVTGYQLQIFARPRDEASLEKQTAATSRYSEPINQSSASSDGKWLAVFSTNVPVSIDLFKLGDAVPQRAAKFVLPVPLGNVPPFSFSPDANWFCFTDASQGQSAIHLIDLRGETPREATVLKADADEKGDAPAKGFQHATFLSDGRLATADYNGRTWFWSINDGTPQGLGSLRDSGFLAGAADSLRLAISEGVQSRIWDLSVEPPQLIGKATSVLTDDNVSSAVLAPDGESLCSAHLNGAVRFWNVSRNDVTELDPLVANPQTNSWYRGMKALDQLLFASSDSSRIGVWKPTRDGMQPVPEEIPAVFVLNASQSQHSLIVREALHGGGTALYQCDTGRVLQTRRIPGDTVHSAAFHAASRRLALGRHNGANEVLELWGWESEEAPARKLAEVNGTKDNLEQLAFAEDGRSLVGRHGISTVQVWDLKDDQIIPRTMLPARTYGFFKLAVAPDGRKVAAVSGNNLSLWDLVSDFTQPTMTYTIPGTKSVAFSSDGRRVAASFWQNGASAGVQIVNVATGAVEKRLTFPGQVDQLDFTADSRHLITGNANGTIYVVRLADAANANRPVQK